MCLLHSFKKVDIESIDLEMGTSKIILQHKAYHLELELPFPVKEEAVKASFDKAQQRLNVVLPVVQLLGKENEEIPKEATGHTLSEGSTTQSKEAERETEYKIHEEKGEQDERANINTQEPQEMPFVETEVHQKVVIVPSYGYYQDSQRVVIAVRIPSISPSSLQVLFHKSYVHTVASKYCAKTDQAFVSCSDTSKKHYELWLPLAHDIEPSVCTQSLSEENLILMLTKASPRLWHSLTSKASAG